MGAYAPKPHDPRLSQASDAGRCPPRQLLPDLHRGRSSACCVALGQVLASGISGREALASWAGTVVVFSAESSRRQWLVFSRCSGSHTDYRETFGSLKM